MNNLPKWLDYSKEELGQNQSIKTKYEYDMKINDIGLYNNTYDDTSILVSKPHMITSLIHNIKLDTNEYIPSGTSIEYYIALAENPTLDDWIPILPNDSKKVVDEKLFFNQYHQATLRFSGNISNIVVKKDGKNIDYTSLEKDIYGRNIIYLKNLSVQSIYTIDYDINDNVIEVQSKDLVIKKTTDVFNSLDDQNKVSLLYNALTKKDYDECEEISIMIDHANGIPGFTFNEIEILKFRNITNEGSDYLYSSGEIKLREDGIKNYPQLKDCSKRQKESFLFTDFNGALPNGYDDKNLRSHYPYIEYYIDKNDIYFAPNKEIFNEKPNIYVSYEHVETPLRFKAILRNNTKKNNITPILNSYKISLM